MLNTITIQGRFTRDPELRRTASGVAVTNFTLAVERDFTENGNKVTDFIDCVVWRTTAEFVARYFKKGQMAIVDGSLQMRKWTDKNGNARTTAEIAANGVYFCEGRNTQATAENGAESLAEPHSGIAEGESAELEDLPNDMQVPFL